LWYRCVRESAVEDCNVIHHPHLHKQDSEAIDIKTWHTAMSNVRTDTCDFGPVLSIATYGMYIDMSMSMYRSATYIELILVRVADAEKSILRAMTTRQLLRLCQLAVPVA
jgi:hypothetical protein